VKRTQNFSKAVFNLSISSGGRLVFASKTRMGIHFPGCWTYRLVKTLTTGTSSAASRARDSELSAKLSQSAASFNQATLSCGLAALAAIWRHSSASRRNLSELDSGIAAHMPKTPSRTLRQKLEGDKVPRTSGLPGPADAQRASFLRPVREGSHFRAHPRQNCCR
jgi:hypothetical protein